MLSTGAACELLAPCSSPHCSSKGLMVCAVLCLIHNPFACSNAPFVSLGAAKLPLHASRPRIWACPSNDYRTTSLLQGQDARVGEMEADPAPHSVAAHTAREVRSLLCGWFACSICGCPKLLLSKTCQHHSCGSAPHLSATMPGCPCSCVFACTHQHACMMWLHRVLYVVLTLPEFLCKSAGHFYDW
jgi:hypothetical protein